MNRSFRFQSVEGDKVEAQKLLHQIRTEYKATQCLCESKPLEHCGGFVHTLSFITATAYERSITELLNKKDFFEVQPMPIVQQQEPVTLAK